MMRKYLFLLGTVCLLTACGGSGNSKESTNDTIVTPELQEVAKNTDELKLESQQLNEKADSILNHLNK